MEKPGINNEPPTVLVVDDSPDNLDLMRGLLCSHYRVKVANSGVRALKILASGPPPDVILLDIMMPVLNGYEVCRQLKAMPACAEIPVIFISALDQLDNVVKGFDAGAVDYVTKPFQAEEVLARVRTQVALQRLRHELEVRKRELEFELESVAEVQRNMLPSILPQFPGNDIAVHYSTSRYAGGDYYDVVKLQDGRLGLLVADAAGHATPAAVLMAMTCVLFRSSRPLWGDPAALLCAINDGLLGVSGFDFVTALYVLIDPGTKLIQLARAGHPPLLLQRPTSGIEQIPADGVFPLGIARLDQVPVVESTLEVGDTLLAYTDGVTERFSPEREEFGVNRLVDWLRQASHLPLEERLDHLINTLDSFAHQVPPDDDHTVVIMRFS